MINNTLGSTAILSSVGARLLINMKDAGIKGLNEGMGGSASKATISGLCFAEPSALPPTVSQAEDGEGRREEEIETTEV